MQSHGHSLRGGEGEGGGDEGGGGCELAIVVSCEGARVEGGAAWRGAHWPAPCVLRCPRRALL
eukprot:scaffold132534_cov48-Phaeocystis_antarctica.AAC.1